ncbi:AGE family epimerase/isomerase [uncultured Paraglaciecola sp.]|uniref:AGE family epimerase/isomerase n=1 Tax=uncultured Paraglaciecola sp. TaxID=1765024 RepID=UPI0030D709B5|tara:strand:- start:233657 stop:234847 length:1191 start_codon:yes stop_codon:yes gene_type:complete
MNYLNTDFLQQHSKEILDFYTPRVVDEKGGYFQNYYDDGTLFSEGQKQLVSSTRIIVNYALAAIRFNNNEYLAIAKHGLDFLENVHWQADSQNYAWTLDNNLPTDMTQQAYGYAFVLLAYAAVKKAGIISSDQKLLDVYEQLEERFWQKEFGLYADEISPDGILSDYRGQNSNMHLCEAMIAAYEATNNPLFLERAKLLAHNVAVRQASLTDNLVWEHYTTIFAPDWEYNKEDPKNLYRPWGFQPGHQTEWAKLLLIINRHAPAAWLVERAVALFDHAYNVAWDEEFRGLIYGFDPQGKWCDADKYFWVQAESFATAALLYSETQVPKYLEQYNAIWQYCDQHFVDHQYGAWFRVLNRDNSKISNEKSSVGAKCDYHTLGACFEVLRAIDLGLSNA